MKRKSAPSLFLDYTLSEGYPFPYQLKQIHKAFRKLASETKENIILTGDSTVGRFAVSYDQYSHAISDPVVSPLKSVLITPWVK